MATELKPTLGSIKTRVRRYVNEVTAAKSFWKDPLVQQVINENYRLRCGELHMAFEGCFVSVAQRNIVADQGRYAWPPNFQRLAKMEVVRTDQTRIPIMRFERHAEPLTPPTAGGDTFSPTYRPVGSGFELEPASSTTIVDGLRIEYYGIPVELEEDNDTLHADWPDLFTTLIVLDSALSLINIEQLMDEGQGLVRTMEADRARWEQRWERYIDARMAASRNRISPFIAGYRDA
jgi:hypothetical protein